MEATRSSETLVYNKLTLRHISEYGILHSHCRENIKSYMNKPCFCPGQLYCCVSIRFALKSTFSLIGK
jgi:hypothetical protein